MASGSQSWNGSWADLPAMPHSRQSSAAVRSAVLGAAATDCGAGRHRGGPVPDHGGDGGGPGADGEDHQPENEAEVGDAGDEERLDRRAPGRLAPAVVADEQEGAPAHDLPPDQGQDQVAGLRRRAASPRGTATRWRRTTPSAGRSRRYQRLNTCTTSPTTATATATTADRESATQVQRHGETAQRQRREGGARRRLRSRRCTATTWPRRASRVRKAAGRGHGPWPAAAGGRRRSASTAATAGPAGPRAWRSPAASSLMRPAR